MSNKRKLATATDQITKFKKRKVDLDLVYVRSVAITTNISYGTNDLPILVVMKEKLFEEYHALFSYLEEKKVANAKPLTKGEMAQLLNLSAVNDIIAELEFEKISPVFSREEEESKSQDCSEDDQDQIYDQDIDPVTLWFLVLDNWKQTKQIIVVEHDSEKEPDYVFNQPLKIVKYLDLLFNF